MHSLMLSFIFLIFLYDFVEISFQFHIKEFFITFFVKMAN